MIGGKIDLTQLKHVVMEVDGEKGQVKGLFIPIEANDLFEGKNGNVYLDIIAFDSVNNEYKQTHAVKQSFPKDKYTKEQMKDFPFIGHLNTKIGGAGGEATPSNAAPGVVVKKGDKVPF